MTSNISTASKLIKTVSTSIMGDTHTPISLFLKLRDKYKTILLLEANDFSSREDSKSYIALDVREEFIVKNQEVSRHSGGRCLESKPISSANQVKEALQEFINNFSFEGDAVFNGCFGHTNFCLLYTSPSPRDQRGSRMPSSA